jgi:hypothetical protein
VLLRGELLAYPLVSKPAIIPAKYHLKYSRLKSVEVYILIGQHNLSGLAYAVQAGLNRAKIVQPML